MAVIDKTEVIQVICPSGTYFFEDNNAETLRTWFEQIEFTLRNLKSGGNLANSSQKNEEAIMSQKQQPQTKVYLEGMRKREKERERERKIAKN